MKHCALIFSFFIISLNALAWGAKGHDIVAAVAEQYLTKSTKKKITKVLGGKSLVYYANWADNAKYTDAFSHTRTWHYLNVNEDEDINNFKRNPRGDAETAINLLVSQLKSDTLSAQQDADALKLLIHIVGDIHCPMHTARGTDRGGNKVKVKFFRDNTNLHRLWDSQLLEAAHKWSYTEWVVQIDRYNPKEIKAIQMSTPLVWASESYEIAKDVYASTPEGSKVSYNEIHKYAPVIEAQLVKAGYRLAAILNSIY